MAEIKSTLDLVMERTKHLTLSAEEKLEMQLQDFVKKVPGYMERLLGGALTPEELLNEIKTQPRELSERAHREIARQLSRTLDLTDRTSPLIPALEMLADPGWAEMLVEIKRCRSEYRKAAADLQRQARERMLARLAAEGIRGSAVVAKLEGDEFWETEDRRLRGPCETRLEALRAAIA
jgi:hypothetical protein